MVSLQGLGLPADYSRLGEVASGQAGHMEVSRAGAGWCSFATCNPLTPLEIPGYGGVTRACNLDSGATMLSSSIVVSARTLTDDTERITIAIENEKREFEQLRTVTVGYTESTWTFPFDRQSKRKVVLESTGVGYHRIMYSIHFLQDSATLEKAGDPCEGEETHCGAADCTCTCNDSVHARIAEYGATHHTFHTGGNSAACSTATCATLFPECDVEGEGTAVTAAHDAEVRPCPEPEPEGPKGPPTAVLVGVLVPAGLLLVGLLIFVWHIRRRELKGRPIWFQVAEGPGRSARSVETGAQMGGAEKA